MASRLADRVREAFSPAGPLASSLRGFEPRPGQVDLAVAWAESLSGGGILVAEAATGIGKTLAYLVPSILSGRRTVVSTGTRTLQQQLVENDIPRVRDAIRVPFSCVVMKGRANYLCLRRWKRFAAEPLFEFAREAAHFARMAAFAETTRTGDLSECPGIPDDFRAWSEVDARSEACDASACADAERCFLMEARRRANDADVVVVNHHLFFADLALRLKRGAGRGREDRDAWPAGDAVPRADALVFDEAHGIEEVASAFFGTSVSLGRAQEIARDLRRAGAGKGAAWLAVLPAVDEFRRASEAFFRSAGEGDGRFFLPRTDAGGPFAGYSRDVLRAAAELSTALSDGPASAAGRGETAADTASLLRRVRAFADDFTDVLSADPSEAVAWGERRGHSVSLCRTPIEVSPVLSEGLWDPSVPTLLTSATLSISGNLSYFRERVGLGAVYARELIVDNEFDFAGNAMVYVPRGVPDPGDGGFPSAAADEAAEILALSGGGALVLCTSHRTLGALAERLRGAIPYTVFVQGDAPRTHLLRAFREEGNAVLIGTGTFWEGIDVPGDPLRCVVIDKLPFAPPGDPVVTARIEAIRRRGGDPFVEYQVPEAVLALRQGVGRLLRRGDDYGVIAILDRRVATRGYGAIFKASLPAMPWARDRAAVAEFFGRFGPRTGRKEGTRR